MNTPKINIRSLAFSLQFSAFSLLLAGCGLPAIEPAKVDAVRLFTLSVPPAGAAAGEATRVSTVELAGHLRRREMAVRIGANEVVFLENMRWAESLDQGIANLLRARLGVGAAACTVAVHILRCEPLRHEGNAVQFSATWVITPDDPKVAAKRGTFNATARTWDGSDHAALVGQLAAAVNELGDALAAEIAALPAGK